MISSRRQVLVGSLAIFAGGVAGCATRSSDTTPAAATDVSWDLSEGEWRSRLTAEQYDVLRESGTEAPFSSELLDEHGNGTFACAGCELPLFDSGTKFESGTGWPSFWQSLDDAVATEDDNSLGMTRTAAHCDRCGGHLGHVFDDGPEPTGLRYCMNGVALSFKPE